MNIFNVEIYCKYVYKENEYKKVGEINFSNISFLPIGSHIVLDDMEFEIISYLSYDNKVKMIVEFIDEDDENCYQNKIYRI